MFHNGNLTEDVFMAQPDDFVDLKNPNSVCKLLKSIYNLKQASRSWNYCFDERVKQYDFIKSEFESCVYRKFSGKDVKFLVSSDATKEAMWLKNFLIDLGVIHSISDHEEIFCDNIRVVVQAKDPKEHHKTKHILGIFLYKGPNQAFQLLEDKVLFKLDWSIKSKIKHHRKSVAFADGSNSNNDNSRLLEKLEALTMKMDSQF
nr:reverse transcriptase [Tanacetum cinerariifolium]